MGKMGDAASLGLVALAILIYADIRKFKWTDLLGLKTPPPPGEFNGIPGPGSAPGVNIWNLFGGGNGARAALNGNGNGNGSSFIDDTAIDETLADIERVQATFTDLPPMPTLEDLGLQRPEYFEKKADYHAEQLRISKAYTAEAFPAFESQLDVLQANLADLSYMVKGHDAGGDIDMTRTDVGAMLQPL